MIFVVKKKKSHAINDNVMKNNGIEGRIYNDTNVKDESRKKRNDFSLEYLAKITRQFVENVRLFPPQKRNIFHNLPIVSPLMTRPLLI